MNPATTTVSRSATDTEAANKQPSRGTRVLNTSSEAAFQFTSSTSQLAMNGRLRYRWGPFIEECP